MRKIMMLVALGAVVLGAQTPDLNGVWKADLQKSKIPGPPGSMPSNYLVVIEKQMVTVNPKTNDQAPAFVETTATWTERGERRSILKVLDTGNAFLGRYQGVPTRMTATRSTNRLTITGETAGHPNTFTRTYERSADGATLKVQIVSKEEGKQTESLLILTKQPASAAAPLQKSEELAEAHFKNVKTASLKSLPVSEFINRMHYFSWSLNRDCEFCHVERKFDLDDKEEKRTARKMIDMTASIDQVHFESHPEVQCFTCHEGHARPLSHPQFADEATAERDKIAKEAADRHK